jgi:hypothetical protein
MRAIACGYMSSRPHFLGGVSGIALPDQTATTLHGAGTGMNRFARNAELGIIAHRGAATT